MYGLLRPLLFSLPPEVAHQTTLKSLDVAHACGLLKPFYSIPNYPTKVLGLSFPNPVGLAAGLDKNGDHFNALADLGFGFIEIGTITPKPQPGNPKPRMFRLPEHQAIINRMGFNNYGVDHLVKQVEKRQYKGVLGINIGKNKDTPVENSVDDYLICLEKVFPLADYVTVNLSSPNTPGLRTLQYGEELSSLIEALKNKQSQLSTQHGKQVPLLVKIAPDLTAEEVEAIGDVFLNLEVDGVIATNTTIARDQVSGHRFGEEVGGLSGDPVREGSTKVIQILKQKVGKNIPIIGVGGICDGQSAVEKIQAGASLVQVYTGFIYRGPKLITEAADAIASANRSEGTG